MGRVVTRLLTESPLGWGVGETVKGLCVNFRLKSWNQVQRESIPILPV